MLRAALSYSVRDQKAAAGWTRRHRGIGPQIGLHRALEVHLVEELPRRLWGRETQLVLKRADTRHLHVVSNRGVWVFERRHDKSSPGGAVTPRPYGS
jgi:hypothetical protein